jgi:hypothetical protein
MASNSMTSPPVEWRWDRFNARKVTTVAWASRNCVGKDGNDISAHQEMQKQVMGEQKYADNIIVSELHEFFRVAATITGMTYHCKQTQHNLACMNVRDIRLSWLQDGSVDNLQRLVWMFYYYGIEIYKIGRSVTHCEWVEGKVLASLNVTYVHLADLPLGQRTCVQQLYSRRLNDLRANIMRRGPTMQHRSMVKKEQPKVPGLFKKHFKRGKSTFFLTLNEQDSNEWAKVSIIGRCRPATGSRSCANIECFYA